MKALEKVHREEWGRLLALLFARFRRLDLVEDALAEAFARAAARWPTDGMPDNPAAWLYRSAQRTVLDGLRHEDVALRKLPLLATDVLRPDTTGGHTEVGSDDSRYADERLPMIFMATHPALAPEIQAALALRFVMGLPTSRIARLFLVGEATMAARITRGKKRISASGIPLAIPAAAALPDRLENAARTVYLAFTSAYVPGEGADLLRTAEAGEAVGLAGMLHALLPHTPLLRCLKALLMLQHARRGARISDGALVLLPDQDRSRWHHGEIAEALGLLMDQPPASGYTEELRLQALIAGAHCSAPRAEATDWPSIAGLYARLEELTVSPVVRLNRAVAVAEADGPAAGLELLEGLDARLPGSHRLAGVRAELLRRCGRTTEAAGHYQLALDLCKNAAERRHLQRRVDDLTLPR